MAPKKGSGNKKGKQPAPKPPPKRPAPTLSSSDEEGDGVQQAILERLQAVEQAAGISAPVAKQGRNTAQVASKEGPSSNPECTQIPTAQPPEQQHAADASASSSSATATGGCNNGTAI
ncbi:UNVERIFIED_CONTAM: hypothetical protein K2H54_055242 [Gekko kuhli]